jgi:hypothetical protein
VDRLCVMDFKTSNAIRKDYYLQVSAYAKAIEDMYGEPVDVCYILRFDKKSGEFPRESSRPQRTLGCFSLLLNNSTIGMA